MHEQRGEQVGWASQAAGAVVRIEPYGDTDAEATLRLAQLCLNDEDDQLGAPLWSTRADMRRELAGWGRSSPGHTLVVAREGGHVVGFGGFERYEGTGVCLLLGPVVEPIARGRGIGHALWRVMLRDAVEAGARELWAVIGSRNGRAERILRAAGFARGDVQAVYRLEPFRHIPAAEDPSIALARAEPPDLDAVAALVERGAPEAGVGREELAAWLAAPESRVYLAMRGSTPIGLAAIDGVGRWVSLLAVQPGTRGIAGELLSRSLRAWWDERPGEWLGLTVRADNVAAVDQYRRQGFDPWLVVARYARAA